MTPCERIILEAYAEYIMKNRVSPSMRDIADITGKFAPSVHKCVCGLEDEGFVERLGDKQRNVVLTEYGWDVVLGQYDTCPCCGSSL